MSADLSALLRFLRARYGDRIVHVESFPPRTARYADPLHPLAPPLRNALRRKGIERLYLHQALAVDAVRAGESVVVTTSTASGKTLCYTLPILERILRDPRIRALFVYPTKALAQDQLDALRSLGLRLWAGIYDGDTPPRDRSYIRDTAQILLTNPDMLHMGILPQHRRWAHVFANLRYVVLDDLHVYRGVFGSHVALVLRRLERVCRAYGAEVQFLCTSATLANPWDFALRLLGRPVRVISEDGSPRHARHFLLWNPPLDPSGRFRQSPYREATELFCTLIRKGVRTIVFTQARRTAELIYRYAADRLPPELASRIQPYRAGYLPEDRREIERRLFTGELMGVVSTSALELGIDVGALDAAVLVGFPGTVASLEQRSGRAGRTGEGLVVLIALADSLDQYLMRHPRFLFGRPVEAAVVDPYNPYLLADHLRCAAAEIPLTEEDFALFGEPAREVVGWLVERGDLARRAGCLHWRGPRYPAAEVNIRSGGGPVIRIVDERGALLGTVEEARAFPQVHPGAIYLHRGETYEVEDLDLHRGIARVRWIAADHYTEARTTTDLLIRRELLRKPLGPAEAYLSEVEVTTRVVEYACKRLETDQVLGVFPVDLPPQRLRTVAVGFDVPEDLAGRIRRAGLDLAGGIHAVEHAAIGLLPLFSMCDRWDIGGVSYPLHPQTGRASIFVYDGYPGGMGFAERAYQVLEEWLGATLEAVRTCPCEEGCPSCVQSPKCGNGNQPLDKTAAILLLEALLRPGADPGRESRGSA
ncbi:MAG: DEAD/DEAH box helicase [Armatimonadetes bacterium]|nr:DEAD/DEAH box helicase [Armatimonadota bacterium]MDW8154841.1 DEAD/DEAH box helicase [Armatimonadota bacterium]